MNRKKQLLSIILSFCIIVASITVGVEEVKASVLFVIDMTQQTENVLEPYYTYEAESKYIFNNYDFISFENSDAGSIYDSYVEERRERYEVGTCQVFTPPEGEWIVSKYAADTSGMGSISVVSAFADLVVYLAKDESNFVELTVEEADGDGMAYAYLPENSGVNEFYDGLDIKVRKTVDKLEKGSLKVEIKGKDGTDYTDMFYYYRDEEMRQPWNEYINNSDYALGGILSKDVKICIKPKEPSLRIKASAGSEGGSISPEDKYYVAFDSSSTQYTITPSDGYKIEKVEQRNQGTQDFTEISSDKYLEGKYDVFPCDVPSSDFLSVTEIKAYFTKKKTFKVTLKDEVSNYKAYTGNDMQTEYIFGTEHVDGTDVNIYLRPDEHYELHYFEDGASGIEWSLDSGSLTEQLDANGGLLYNVPDIKENHELGFMISPKSYEINFDIGENGGIYTYTNDGEYPKYVKMNGVNEQIKYDNDSSVYYIKADENYKPVFKDNGVDITNQLGTPNSDGYYQYQITNIDKDHEFTLKFITSVNITVVQGENGTITPGTGLVNSGENKTFTITPNKDYKIKDVKADGVSVLNKVTINNGIGTYTFENVNKEHTITAEFIKVKTNDTGSSNSGSTSNNSGSSNSGSTSNNSGNTNSTSEKKDNTLKVGTVEVDYTKDKDGNIFLKLTDNVIKELLKDSKDGYIHIDVSSLNSNNGKIEFVISGAWFSQDGKIKGLVVESFSTVTINDKMLRNLGIEPTEVVTIGIEKGSIIVDMQINGKSVDQVDKQNPIKIEYKHNIKNVKDSDNVVAVEIKENKETIIPMSMLNSEGNELIIMTPNFGRFEAIEKQSKNFSDVNNCWAKESIDFVTAREIFNGISDTEFAPDRTVTRGMFVTILGRLYGAELDCKLNFTDVNPNQYYAPYAAWAAENGIVKGVGKNLFEPNKAITHQEMAVMLTNYIKFVDYNLAETEEKITFNDEADIAAWAKESVEFMQLTGILNGMSEDNFTPANQTTRAEVATAIANFIKVMIENYSIEKVAE